MNTTLAVILTIVVTNWTSIGNFTDTRGRYFDVQEGQIMTNTVADVLLDELPPEAAHYAPNRIMNRRFGTTNRFVLKSILGPVIAERKVILITNVWVTNFFSSTSNDAGAEFRRKWLEEYWRDYRSNRIIYNSNVEQTNKP